MVHPLFLKLDRAYENLPLYNTTLNTFCISLKGIWVGTRGWNVEKLTLVNYLLRLAEEDIPSQSLLYVVAIILDID